MVGSRSGVFMESSDVAEIKRHFNVVAEGLEKKIQLVAEGVSALDDRTGRVEDGFSSVDGRLARVDDRVMALDQRVARIEDRITSLEEKMERGFEEVKAMIKISYAELDR